MKLGPVELPALAVPRLGLAAFRRRAVVHLAFLLLALATVGLVLTVLIDQKQRAYQRYAQGFRQSLAEIVLQLRHPSGQLALLNPTMSAGGRDGQAPVLLPFSAIDFDDQNKAQRAVEMAGCGLRWPDGASLCAAVGANAYAGGFLYLVGSLESGPLTGRQHGALDLAGVHRARVTLTLRGETQTWIAPFEGAAAADGTQRGRLTGFVGAGPQLPGKARPVREFRGWLWREGPCAEGSSGPSCARRTFYSIRLPVEAFQAALFDASGRYGSVDWTAIGTMVVASVVGWGLVINTFSDDASWNNWQGYLLGPLGLGGKDGAWAFANLGVLFALLIGLVGGYLLRRRTVQQQEA